MHACTKRRSCQTSEDAWKFVLNDQAKIVRFSVLFFQLRKLFRADCIYTMDKLCDYMDSQEMISSKRKL